MSPRESLDTVINATDLRTGSAFRFGSRQSGCWRFGTIASEDALVADAVAASAAYPVFLPALERKYRFVKNGQASAPTRVLLTDGGVFENLGVSPMEPGRIASISTNVFDPSTSFVATLVRAYLTTTATRRAGLPGCIGPFSQSFARSKTLLGNACTTLLTTEGSRVSRCAISDRRTMALPWIPADLPTRDEVRHYPTDFAAMSRADVDRLALRGEILTRLLVAYYLPDL